MIKHILDLEKSREIYDCCKNEIEMKECYNNVFNVVTSYFSDFVSGKYKVAYGYVTVFEHLLCRHCFIVDENGKAIDPTIFATSRIIDSREYYTMKIFEDIDDYFKAVERENYYPALERYLKDNSKIAQQWATENGYILTG